MSVELPELRVANLAAWRRWLARHHATSPGVLLRLAKGGAKGLTYREAVEGALIWGWIDSTGRALDDTSWLQRYTPRKPRSMWSKINRTKAEALIAAGEMAAPGLAAVVAAKADGRWDRAYDSPRTQEVPADLAAALAATPRARAFFDSLSGANRFAILYRVQTAARPATRAARIARFVELCAAGKTLHPPTRKKP